LAVTIPVTIYLVVVWALHAPYKKPGPMRTVVVPVAAVLILVSSATPVPVLITGLILTALVILSIITGAAVAPERAGADRPID
jgi:hypothetical protein